MLNGCVRSTSRACDGSKLWPRAPAATRTIVSVSTAVNEDRGGREFFMSRFLAAESSPAKVFFRGNDAPASLPVLASVPDAHSTGKLFIVPAAARKLRPSAHRRHSGLPDDSVGRRVRASQRLDHGCVSRP